ncbi:MAG TPA: TMEM175 family protein [Bacteroidia bacterium]|jgi:uncharacterized membrane protein|nr:TMEM175 family protein [Bacteroidia bacterium]
MNKTRLEAFSDGVFAILITIMVLEIKVPHGSEFGDLMGLIPIFLSYVLSFIYLGIYWNNHHHMLHTIKYVSGSMLWANMHLLFWISLVPFATAWIGETGFVSAPMVVYGCILLFAAIAYFILQSQIIKQEGEASVLKKAIGNDIKGKMSPIIYLIAIISGLFNPGISGILYVVVALIWLIPDKRIERTLKQD